MKEGDVVLCVVKKIVGTTVFVEIEGDGEGTIIFSEVAPGRIRNIRDYVVPNKKIVCKVLRIDERTGHTDLSLRRVTMKERKEVLERYEREKSITTIMKAILGEKANEIVEKIKEKEGSLLDFVEKAKTNAQLLETYMSKEQAERFLKILRERKEKEIKLKKSFMLKSKASDGIEIIKKILSDWSDKINYTGGGTYMLTIKTTNPKEGNAELQKALELIERRAKERGCEYAVVEKK